MQISFPYLDQNAAYKKPAFQSSTHHNYKAINAVDGLREHILESNSCTHTSKERNPWWAVDLVNNYFVQSVLVTTRGDCCRTCYSIYNVLIQSRAKYTYS